MEELEVSTEHLHEQIHESATESKEKWIMFVALSTAFIAVLAAIAGLMGGHHSNEALLKQIEASDKWSQYQSKSIKSEINSNSARILTAISGKSDTKENQTKLAHYEKDKEEIMGDAKGLETESKKHLDRHVNFSIAVTIYQIAIAIAAISILTRRKLLWMVSLVLAAGGTFYLVLGFI
jgi:hypothetical protein